MSKYFMESLLEYPWNNPICDNYNHFWNTKKKKSFPKDRHDTFYDVVSYIPLAATIPNPFIKLKHLIILQYPSQYGISLGSQKAMNNTSDVVS